MKMLENKLKHIKKTIYFKQLFFFFTNTFLYA